MENKLAKKLGHPIVLVASILSLVITVVSVINFILSFVKETSHAIGIIYSIFSIIVFALIGTGLLILYLNGRKQKSSVAGTMIVKVAMLVKGIISCTIFALSTIVLIIYAIMGVPAFFEYEMGDYGTVAIILVIVLGALFVLFAIYSLKFVLNVNGTLGSICEGKALTKKNPLFGSILLILSNVIQMTYMIMALFDSGAFWLYEKYGNFIGALYAEGEPGGFIDFVFEQSTKALFSYEKVQCVFILINAVIMITLFVFCICFFNSLKDVQSVEVQPDNDSAFDFDPNVGNDETMLLQPDPDPVPVAVTVATGTIVSMGGEDSGYMYPIKDGEEYIIGKDARMCHIVIPEKYQKISRRHCGIRLTGDSYEVIDYSTNGTYIDNVKRIEKGVYTPVPKGSVVNLAKQSISYRLG